MPRQFSQRCGEPGRESGGRLKAVILAEACEKDGSRGGRQSLPIREKDAE